MRILVATNIEKVNRSSERIAGVIQYQENKMNKVKIASIMQTIPQPPRGRYRRRFIFSSAQLYHHSVELIAGNKNEKKKMTTERK